MDIDIKILFQDAAISAGAGLKNSKQTIREHLFIALNNNKEAIGGLVEARVSGRINQQQFEVELEREKAVLESDMLQYEIASVPAVQKAVDAALNQLTHVIATAV